MMPIMDGYELLEKLKSNEKWRNIPVIMLTARAAIDDKLKALRIGVDDYILKPFNEGELLARIENLLSNAIQRQVSHLVEEEIIIEKASITQADAKWLQHLEELILDNIGKFAMTSDWLTKELFISRTQLFLKIKQLTGLTLQQYIKEIRLEKARIYLQNRTYSTVKEVVYAVGLKDTKSFSKNFKKRFGKSPSEYLG
jgi:YesN/AraC family two-component response regulator